MALWTRRWWKPLLGQVNTTFLRGLVFNCIDPTVHVHSHPSGLFSCILTSVKNIIYLQFLVIRTFQQPAWNLFKIMFVSSLFEHQVLYTTVAKEPFRAKKLETSKCIVFSLEYKKAWGEISSNNLEQTRFWSDYCKFGFGKGPSWSCTASPPHLAIARTLWCVLRRDTASLHPGV